MKKNGYRLPDCVPALLFKRLLMVKMIVLCMCFFSVNSMANYGFAQEKITLNLENVSYKKAFKAIEKQTSYRFVYNDDVLPSDKKISISVRSQSLPDVLKKMLESTSLTFKLMGTDLVIITTGLESSRANQAKQFVEVTGTVVNANNQPLANVSVLEKGTANGTTTSEAGKFSLNVSSTNAVLVVSYVGFTAQEVSLAGRASVTVTLEEDQKEMNQVVVVGYGTQKRKDVTGAIASVPKSRLSQLPVTNVLQAIQGSVAGVTITQNSSVPGSTAVVMVRGINTIPPSQTNTSSFSPLIILDGTPFAGSTNDINPNDIASIDILKDVSAVAIYGVKGANGVIIITTKRGQTGKPVVRYSGYTGFENFSHVLEPMSGAAYVQKYKDYLIQTGQPQTSPVPNSGELPNYTAGKTTDWIKEVSQQGLIQDHNVTISGGSEGVRYYISGEYLKQKGVLKGYQYQRANIRSNLDITVTNYLTIGTSLFYTNNNYDGGRVNLLLAGQMSPYGQQYTATGTYNIYPMSPELLYTSPLIDLYRDVYNRSNNFNTNAYADVKLGFIKGLKYRLNAAYAFTPARTSDYTGRASNNQNGAANISNSETRAWTIENILSYAKDWNEHHLDLTGLYSSQKNNYFTSNVNASGFINDLLSYNQLGAGATVSGNTINNNGVDYRGSYANQSTTLSQMGRINYSYDSRYIITFTARRDGYSAFGKNTSKYGLFSSGAVAWNLGSEPFLASVKAINNLKLRFSYGQAGDPAVNINQTTTLDATNRWSFNGVGSTGAVASVLGNADLHWATTTGLNAGIDFSLFDNRISGTIDYYNTRTEDILLDRNLPAITGIIPPDFNNPTGATSIKTNLGKLANQGIEVTINTANVRGGDFQWETSINYSANRNEIKELYGDGKNDIGNRWFIGQPVRIIYDYKLDGVWQVGETRTVDPSAKPGDLKFADVSGPNGTPDGIITADDRVVLGTPLPKWIGGLTNTFHYKNFHLNIFLQTSRGGLRNNAVLDNADQSGKINTPAEIGYWTTDNKSNTRPALSYFNSRGYGYASDNSYTRIKDVTLSYIFSPAIAERLHLGGLTAYASGRNLYTWTDWVGWDPEYDYSRQTSTNSHNYPLVRSIVFGLNITLK